jgi:hypothetical protein
MDEKIGTYFGNAPPPLIRHFCNTKLPTLAQVTLFLGMLTIFFLIFKNLKELTSYKGK